LSNDWRVELQSLPWEPLEPVPAEWGFVMLCAFAHILAAKFEQGVDQTGECVGHRGDGFGLAKARAEASLVDGQGIVTAQPMLGGGAHDLGVAGLADDWFRSWCCRIRCGSPVLDPSTRRVG
jgi:hypothetical protein